jgi:hemoglobin-like flavoprotein
MLSIHPRRKKAKHWPTIKYRLTAASQSIFPPWQYPLIGQKLLQAMKDVLQDAATDEVMAAWAEAYEALANIFIQKEKAIYQQAEQELTERLTKTAAP